MQLQPNTTIGIIGFGRFGELLAELLLSEYHVLAYDSNLSDNPSNYCVTASAAQNTLKIVTTIAEITDNCNTIFIAVPIRQFDSTVSLLANKLKPNTTVIDVCSVKMYPVKIMLQYLAAPINIIATHPLFGPNSISDINACKIVMHNVRATLEIFSMWQQFFSRLHINVIEMTPEQHDELAARSQNITHFIGRALDDANFESTGIDTKGFQKLLELKQQTCNDSWELFYDLQYYNPYSQQYINKFITSVKKLHDKILTNTQKNCYP